MLSVFSLLVLVYFIFAIVGVFLFSNVTVGVTGNVDEIYNFSNFGHAFLTMLRCSTGENWN